MVDAAGARSRCPFAKDQRVNPRNAQAHGLGVDLDMQQHADEYSIAGSKCPPGTRISASYSMQHVHAR